MRTFRIRSEISAVAVAATFVACATIAPDAERRISVVYDETSGVRVLFDKNSVEAVQVACHDDAKDNRCWVLYCKPPAGEAVEPAEPKAEPGTAQPSKQ